MQQPKPLIVQLKYSSLYNRSYWNEFMQGENIHFNFLCTDYAYANENQIHVCTDLLTKTLKFQSDIMIVVQNHH